MSWEATGEISEQRYAFYKPIIIFFRILGLCPLTSQRNKSKLLLRFSPLIMIYGFAFGAFTIFMAYWGIITELTVNKEDAIRVTSDIDKLVSMIDLAAYSSIFCCGIYVYPMNFESFFYYLQCIHKVDSIIKTTYGALEKYIMIIAIAFVFIFNVALGAIHMSACYEIIGHKIGLIGVMHRFVFMDFVALMVNIIECTNQLLLNAVRKRINTLNVLLKIEYDRMKIKAVVGENQPVVVFTEPRYRGVNIREYRIVGERQWIGSNQTDDVIALAKAYQLILDAADALNDFLGFSTVVMVVAILWGLIESSYFFLLAFSGTKGDYRDAAEIPGTVTVIMFHTFRVLLVTEPPHACLAQIETTKGMVCNLLSCNVNRKYRQVVSRFAMILELRQLEFSANGLFVVDRALFTALLDTIVTLLTILMQYRQDFSL